MWTDNMTNGYIQEDTWVDRHVLRHSLLDNEAALYNSKYANCFPRVYM